MCVMGFQGTEIRLGQSDHPLVLVFLHPLSGSSLPLGLLGPLTLRGPGLRTVPLTSAALSALNWSSVLPACACILGVGLLS